MAADVSQTEGRVEGSHFKLPGIRVRPCVVTARLSGLNFAGSPPLPSPPLAGGWLGGSLVPLQLNVPAPPKRGS